MITVIKHYSGEIIVNWCDVVGSQKLGRGFTLSIGNVRKIMKLMLQFCDDETVFKVQQYLDEHSPKYAGELKKLIKVDWAVAKR